MTEHDPATNKAAVLMKLCFTREMAASTDHGNKSPGPIKAWEFLGEPRDCQLLTTADTVWSIYWFYTGCTAEHNGGAV